ncbi:MAG: shikimate dehydrogenase, partial [Lachnospiraceae bacterium]|nr:shikimate dehydrogenase [Lachnospiraceae bacterium]
MDGKTRLCGLIGNPVEHTMSPVIHNTLAEKCGHNLVYVPFLVEQGRIEEAVTGAYALNVLGMNVTVPYKSDVIGSLVEVDELASHIGAVNTLVRTEEGYKGYNTDMTGLYRAMTSEGIRIEGEEIVLLGAGGAARAVAYLCGAQKAAKVYLLNRTLEKA